jgi:hypothetical protein
MQACVKLGLAVAAVALSASSAQAGETTIQSPGTTSKSPAVETHGPDVAKTPTPGGPVPIPYPNMGGAPGKQDQAAKKEPMLKNDSTYKTTTGDEASGAPGDAGKVGQAGGRLPLRTTIAPSTTRQSPKTDFGTVMRQGSLPTVTAPATAAPRPLAPVQPIVVPRPVIQTQPAQRAPVLQSTPLMRK